MSGGGTAVATMRPDETPLNGDANHSYSPMDDEVVNLLKHEVSVCKSLKDANKNDSDNTDLKSSETGNGDVKDVKCPDEPTVVSETTKTNGNGELLVAETGEGKDTLEAGGGDRDDGEAKSGDKDGSHVDDDGAKSEDKEGDGRSEVDGVVKSVDSEETAAEKQESNETKTMDVDGDEARSVNGDHGDGDQEKISNGNVESSEEAAEEKMEVSSSEVDESNVEKDDVGSDSQPEVKETSPPEATPSTDKASDVDNGETTNEPESTGDDKDENSSNNTNTLSIQDNSRTSVSDLVKKAVATMKRSGSFCSESSLSGTKTPPVGEAEEEKCGDTHDVINISDEKIDDDLEAKLLDSPDNEETKSVAAKDSNANNCDKDNKLVGDTCEDIPDSLLDEDDKPEALSGGGKEEEDEEINEDELLKLDSEKPSEEAEPDANLLNDSKDEHNDSSVVILDDDNDVEIQEVRTVSPKPTVPLDSTDAKSEAENVDVTGVSESEKADDAKTMEITDVKEDAPKLPANKESESKDVPVAVPAQEVEDVDSDYEVMEISLDDIKPSLKPEQVSSMSASSKVDVDEASKDSTSRKRAVPSSDTDDSAPSGSDVKRTKLESAPKEEEASSRASTPDCVVCLPCAPAAKDEIKPVCDGDKKTINEKAFGELIRIKLNQCLMREIEKVVAPLRKRVSELQASNEAWKSQASELQKKILELNIALQRKERKRKAHKNDKAKAQHAKAAAAAAAAAASSSNALVPKITGTPPKAQVATSAVKPVMLTSANKPIQAAPTFVQNNVRPIQIQASNSQLQAIQIPMSMSGVRNVLGQQTLANVQLATAQHVAGQNTQNIVYNVNRSGMIQGTLAPVSNSTPTQLQPVRAVLESSPTGTFATTSMALQNNTVRSMLSTKRDVQQPTLVMVPNTAQQKPTPQPQTLLKVPNVQTVTTANNATKIGNNKQMFVDLTDDDDANPKKLVQPMPVAMTPNTAVALRTTAPAAPTLTPQSVALPVRPGQITLRPGTQIVLNGSTAGAPMFFQPLAAQRMAGPGTVQSKPQTFIYSPTTIPAQQNRVLTLLPQQQAQGATTLVSAGGVTGATPIQTTKVITTPQVTPVTIPTAAVKHPAPLPPKPANPRTVSSKKEPPKPALKISKVSQGIVLSWNMQMVTALYEEISSYQLYAYQETSSPPSTTLWKKVGDVKALPLPMACTLTQFQEGNRYHFAVRAIDVHHRVGPFSDPSSIHLTKSSS